ncbi:MAG TPA: hypothetical protein VHN14_24315 [Kofleriaceae bacterium]|jgi:hypothetical protein|nr:hypothetical protein [Kofleriaceae bacterium]
MSKPKRGPGRPPLGAAARNRPIRVLVTAAEEAAIRAAAELEEISVSDWGRDRLVPAARRQARAL